ncbi:MAG: hypothetical protein NUV98_04050 [Candidatus Roizmanbacteria bacterium]|nr:hypothetical protein [Candidatus Roizmanbacteria bacterium]
MSREILSGKFAQSIFSHSLIGSTPEGTFPRNADPTTSLGTYSSDECGASWIAEQNRALLYLLTKPTWLRNDEFTFLDYAAFTQDLDYWAERSVDTSETAHLLDAVMNPQHLYE